MSWIDEYFESNDKAEVIFEIDYLNSSSFKSLFDIFAKLEKYRKEGKEINTTWKYPEDDDDLLETDTI